MIEATSCGGVVVFRGKILLLYKNYKNKYEGWVLPKGTVEPGEEFKDTALREVREESGARASVIKYVGKSDYTFNVPDDTVEKEVHWYLMMADSYYSKPQREEYFEDSGYYKFHEAYHLLKFANEKQILEKAYNEYLELKKTIYGETGNIIKECIRDEISQRVICWQFGSSYQTGKVEIETWRRTDADFCDYAGRGQRPACHHALCVFATAVL